jgi:UDP-N-acetylmuramate--alanine ligase
MNGEVSDQTIVVVEADEFDRSFLRLFPTMAIVTSADADHLDIYGDHNAMLVSFRDFIKQIHKGGELVIHSSIKELAASNSTVNVDTYGHNMGQYYASNIVTKGGLFEFDLNGFEKVITNINLGVPGFHNMENAIAAALIALKLGISESKIKEAIASFKGVKRRFEFVIQKPNLVYIDDYAHHPTEIEAFLKSLKSMYAGKKITVIFQPHLFTRTRDFAKGFSESLSIADEVYLMDIYPAREEAIPGVTSDMLFDDIISKVKVRCSKSNVMKKLENSTIEVLATVGAGDIDTFVRPIKEYLLNKNK